MSILQEEVPVGQENEEEQELQELHFTRSISPSPLPPARLDFKFSLFFLMTIFKVHPDGGQRTYPGAAVRGKAFGHLCEFQFDNLPRRKFKNIKTRRVFTEINPRGI